MLLFTAIWPTRLIAKLMPAARPPVLPRLAVLLALTWQLYRHRFAVIAGYGTWLLLPFLLSSLLGFLPDSSLIAVVQLILGALQTLLWIAYLIILIRLTDRQHHNSDLHYPELSQDLNLWLWPAFLILLVQLTLGVAGLFLLLVPGLIVFTVLGLALPALILKPQPAVLAALRESWQLTRTRLFGSTWRIVVIPTVFILLYSLALSFVLTAILAWLGTDPSILSQNLLTAETWPMWLRTIEILSDTFVLTPLLAIYLTRLYQIMKMTTRPS